MKTATKPQLRNPHERLINDVLLLDEDTGLPANYESFFAAYRPMMLAIAARANIPIQDREDAVHEVQIKFWQKNGLDMFDPDKGTQFATLLRNWAGLFMLQEMDKVKKSYRHVPTGDDNYLLDKTETDFTKETLADVFVLEWIDKAQKALEAADKHFLVPVLHLCVSAAEANQAPTRADVAQAAGVKITKATTLVKQLRQELTNAGLGIESLYYD